MEREAYDLMDRQEETHWWFVARRRIIDSLIARHVGARPNARVLEAGCGTGGNLALLAAHGDLSAFEFDSAARAIAARKSGIDVIAGHLPDGVAFPDGSFDLVALLDVLEHIDDDFASLASLRAKLAFGGRILITVPAAPWLWSEHDEIHHHKRRYTKRQLEQLVREAGFAEVKAGYFNSLLFPLAVLDRLLTKAGMRKGSHSDQIGPRMNRVFEAIFASEARLMRWVRFPLGLSIYAIASR